MDTNTAQQVILNQADLSIADSFLSRLQQYQAPLPGQVTALLLALRVMTETLSTAEQLERSVVYALHQLAYESRQAYERGKLAKIDWPPLLDADLERIAISTAKIFRGDVAK